MGLWEDNKELMKRTKQLLSKAMNYKEISEQLNKEFGSEITSRSSVRHACKYYFPDLAEQSVNKYMEIKNVVRWTEEMLESLKKYYKDGMTTDKIADALNEEFDKNMGENAVRCAVARYITDDIIEKVNQQKAEKEVDIPEAIERDKVVTRLMMENQLLARKYKTVIKEEVLQENILNVVREHVQTLKPVPVPKKLNCKDLAEKSVETAVLLVSDTHIGEIVSAEETGGISQYDFSVFQYRMQYLAEVVVDILKNKLTGYKIDELVIAMLGDIVSGIIHDELVESAEDTVIEWVTGGAIVFAQFLQELAQEYSSIVCPCVIGNHGRMSQKIRFKKRYVNWDYVFYQMLSMMLVNQPNIKFIIPKSFYYLHQIEGHNFLFLHGDNIRSWQGIPWYGIQRANDRLAELLNSKEKIIDYIAMGHFHNLGVLDRVHGGQLILNGSFIGANEYSIGSMFRSNQPKQYLFGVHSRKGKTFSYDINLKNAPMKDLRYYYNKSEQLADQVREKIYEDD